MMATWLLQLQVQKTVLYVMVRFDIFNLTKKECCDEGSLAFLATGDECCTILCSGKL